MYPGCNLFIFSEYLSYIFCLFRHSLSDSRIIHPANKSRPQTSKKYGQKISSWSTSPQPPPYYV